MFNFWRKLLSPNHLKAYIPVLVTVMFVSCSTMLSFADNMSSKRQDEVRGALEDILSSDEFAQKPERTGIIEILKEKAKEILTFIIEKFDLEKKVKRFFAGTEIAGSTALIISVVGVMILVSIIGLILFIILRNIRLSKRVKQKEDELLLMTLRNPEQVEESALLYYAQGDYKLALRYLYISSLLRLNELNVIRIDKAKTNKQYLYEIKNGKVEIFSDMVGFTHDFNLYWYGNKAANKEKFDFWYQKYNLLIKEAS